MSSHLSPHAVRRMMESALQEEEDATLVELLLGEGSPPEEVEVDRDDDCPHTGQKPTRRFKRTFPLISAAIAEHEAAIDALDAKIDLDRLFLENKRLKRQLKRHGISVN